jgi:hypothetical protein
METKDKIPFNSMDDHQIHDYVYGKVIKDFNILYERTKMGGDEGIHLGFLKQDPPFQVGPNL